MVESAENRPNPIDAFELRSGTVAALVGAGGKSSLMFALGRDLRSSGMTSILTTTTRLWAWQKNSAAHVCRWPDDIGRLPTTLSQFRSCLLVGATVDDKVSGIPPETVAILASQRFADVMLVEADGARGMAIKAPAVHEPAIPPGTTTVIVVVSITALEGSIEAVAFRPKLASKVIDYLLHEILTPESVAHLLAHKDGGQKNVPANADVLAFINQITTAEQRTRADSLANYLLQTNQFKRVILGNTRIPNPVLAVRECPPA